MRILTALLLSFAIFGPVTLVRAQVLGESAVSTPVYEALSAGAFRQVAAASDGTRFLAVWSDGFRLSAAPLGSDGSALLSSAIVLTTLRDETVADNVVISGVAVVWSGGAYDVFWGEQRRSGAEAVIVMERVADDGHVVSERKTIASVASINRFHAAAASGGQIIITTSAGYMILDEEGNQKASGPFGNTTSPGAVFSTGTAELTLINAFGSMRLDPTGKFVPGSLRKTPTYEPRLACHSDDCLIVFRTSFYYGAPLVAARFNGQTSEVGELIAVAANGSDGYDLAPAGSGYVLTTPALIMRLDEAGRLGGITMLPASEAVTSTLLVPGSRGTLLLLAGKTLSTSLITSTGMSQPVVVARAANSQISPAIATSGAQYLTVWRESSAVYAARMSLDGTPLDGRGILLAGVVLGTPSAAFDGKTYAVACQTSGTTTDILRIDPASGRVMSRQTICGRNLRIAAGDLGILYAAWVDCAGDVVAGPLGGFPNIIAKSTVLPGGINVFPALAWNGSIWLVTWEEQIQGGLGPEPWKYYFYTAAVRAARVTRWFTPLDTNPIEIATSGGPTINDSRVASDGVDFLVAWWGWNIEQEVHARRVSSSGATSSADTLVMRGRFRDLVWDGKQFALAFSTTFQGGDVGVAHVRSSGNPLPFETVAISATKDAEAEVSLLSLGNGRVVAAYTRFAHESLYGGSSRVFVTTPRAPRDRASRGSQ